MEEFMMIVDKGGDTRIAVENMLITIEGSLGVRLPTIYRDGKSNLAKPAGAEPAGQMRDEKCARRCRAKHICK